jgi:hypothetical protein
VDRYTAVYTSERLRATEFSSNTVASWHVQAGTSLHVLQELGGCECVEMVRKYAHLSSDHLAGYSDRMSGGLKLTSREIPKPLDGTSVHEPRT